MSVIANLMLTRNFSKRQMMMKTKS